MGVELESDGPDTPIEIEGDEARLGQVLTNLLSNAAKFSPRGGRVRVEARLLRATQSKARRARVDVFDDGPGVPPEFEPRLFERFAQADSSATRVSGGSGLGLSISRAIVEQHDGTLAYNAATSGQKHSFSFELPASDTSFLAPIAQQKILVCEDDPEIACLLGLMLGEQGFPGLALWLMIQLGGLWSMERLRRRFKRSVEQAWISALASALLQAHIIYLVGATFVGIAFQPFVFMLIGLQIGLGTYARRIAGERVTEKTTGWAVA